MSVSYAERYRGKLPSFKEMTEKFYKKEVSVKDYKGFSGFFGSYAQKGGEASMLRLRMNAGQITKEKLKFIAESIEKHQVDKIHFTTCQTVQLHNLNAASVCEIMEAAVDVGIITMGGGGDFPRNVMCSPLTGAQKGEYFDVMPCAQAAADYLMGLVGTVKLPRKLKVGFSNCPENVPHATFRDLGFAAAADGTFTVYSAGGLGNNPRMGVKVAEHVAPEKILYYIQAMVETFVTYGNYENRGKARTRYMQETLGEEGYVKAYNEKLEEVLKKGGLDIRIPAAEFTKKGDGSTASGPRIMEEKYDGLYTVSYHPIGGVPGVTKIRELYETIKDMEDVELRLSPDEGVYIVHLTGDEAKKVLAATEDSAKTLFQTSVACIGASICQVGVRDSQALLKKLVETEQENGFADGVLPKIHISGCPSSCGTHQIGDIGFHGGVKVVEGQAKPAFTLHVNGCDEQGNERFGENWGVMLEEDIPAFIADQGRAVSGAESTYAQWAGAHMDEMKAIAERYIK